MVVIHLYIHVSTYLGTHRFHTLNTFQGTSRMYTSSLQLRLDFVRLFYFSKLVVEVQTLWVGQSPRRLDAFPRHDLLNGEFHLFAIDSCLYVML